MRVNITELTPLRIITEKEIITSNPEGKIIRKIKKYSFGELLEN